LNQPISIELVSPLPAQVARRLPKARQDLLMPAPAARPPYCSNRPGYMGCGHRSSRKRTVPALESDVPGLSK